MKRCDLHCHSCYSDGSETPAELIRLAEEAGLGALALTDHNSAKGLPEFMAAGRDSAVIAVPGCEFTTEYGGKELHVVGLFFAEETWPEIEDYVELMRMAKHHANVLLMEALQRGGFDVHYEEAAALTDADEFNRAHVARLLLQKGYVASISEAFDTLLQEGGPYYVPPRRLGSLGTIRFIKEYGAVAVLAHPFKDMNREQLIEFLPKAKLAGLDAIETHYSGFDAETTREAENLAALFGLKQSGGSDFHGAAKPKIRLGTGCGDLEVPFSFYEDLKHD